MIKYSTPLIPAEFTKRYKRFFVDAILSCGQEITAHCPNTGTMQSCLSPGQRIYLSRSDHPKRKLKYTLEYSQNDQGLIGLNTSRSNRIVKDALDQHLIDELTGYRNLKPEALFEQGCRFDFLLSDHVSGAQNCFVEVKNVTLWDQQGFCFPDAKTERGQKHLRHLIKARQNGYRAVMLFVVNRPEKAKFRPAAHIDPDYADVLSEAQRQGVEVLLRRSHNTLEGSQLSETIPWHLAPSLATFPNEVIERNRECQSNIN